MYDYLIVGAGVFGSVFARLATDKGYKCLVVDKRNHIAGNCYTENIEGINVHKYGPHIFHCNDKSIWDFVNRFTEFNNFVNSPIAISDGVAYSLPFNMYTFNQMWGVLSPDEAIEMINSQKPLLGRDPLNLEEQAISLVGVDIYNKLIKNYTRKQWMKDPAELPASIIKRLPVRFTWNNNYFTDKYQGIPVDGYTRMFEAMLDGVPVHLNVDYLANKEYWNSLSKKTIFTGKIDEYFDYKFGELEYRTLRFDTEVMDVDNFQGCAVVNYSDLDVPWTRIIEHKHFEVNSKSKKTVVTKEIPDVWTNDKIPYYPIGDDVNNKIFKLYQDASEAESRTYFGGRLAEYKYYDMHQVIGSAMALFARL